MEYVEGETIEQRIERSAKMEIGEAVDMMIKILEAMGYVHRSKRIHRDIKPSNIMVRPDGTICIIDFGIAKDARIGSTGHTIGQTIGTNGYMSPEQADGNNIDHRTDIYSLGCVFYYMLTGKHAVQKGSNQYETVANILYATMPLLSQSLPEVPPAIERIYEKAVDKNMMHRYQSASEFRQALLDLGNKCNACVTIGSSKDNDIVIDNEFVSRHHLEIRGEERTDRSGSAHYELHLIDHSTNGTGIDGRPLHNSTITLHYSDRNTLPEVLLAARTETPVDWDRVIEILRKKGWMQDKGGNLSEKKTQCTLGKVLICFFILLIVLGIIIFSIN